MKIAEKFFLTVIVFILFSVPINCNASEYITKTAILTPVADTYVYRFGTTASPLENELRVGCRKIGDTTDAVISLLRFDVSEVSESSQIKSALLHVYALDIKATGDFSSFQTVASSKNWMESDPEYPIETLADTPAYDSRHITGISGTSPDLYLWDITDLVQAWIDGRPNYGIVLTADLEKSSDYIRFYASENPMYKPCIKVTYTVPATSFTIEPVNKDDEGIAAGEISKPAGTVDPDPAVPAAKEAVSILDHPASQSQEFGKAVSFQVRSAGSGPLSYQWKKNHIDIQGAVSESLTLKSVQKKDEGIYSCEVSNDLSNDISDNAELTVIVLSQITTQAEPEIENSEAFPEEPVNDSKADSLPVKAEKVIEVTEEDADHPPAVDPPVKKDAEPDALFPDEPEIINPPEILSHPAAQTRKSGESVTFSVSVSGTGPFAYQWKKDGTEIPYAILDSITLSPVGKDDAGVYLCEVSNKFSTAVSNDAVLSIIEAPVASAEKIEDSPERPAEKPVSLDLLLSPPTGQGQYVRNGNVLRVEGTAVSGMTLVLAHLEDDQGFLIRDISKSVTINSETGHISGAVFVGSFRSALSVRLRIRVTDDSARKTVDGLSGRLFVDNTDPEITVSKPSDQTTFKYAPIAITGLAADSFSGITAIEISTDNGTSYRPVDSFDNGRWQYLFTPKTAESTYTIKARATDTVGRSTVSGGRVIHYQAPSMTSAPSPSIRKTAIQPDSSGTDKHGTNADKSFEENGIYTYRIISLGKNQFEPSDLFTLDEEMAIIVKGHGGEVVTIKLIDPAVEKVVFELSDYIPENKHKMWKWKLSKTGIFKATLFIGGSPRDDVLFKIIQ